MSQNIYENALITAARYIRYKPRTSGELRRKLSEKKYPGDIINRIIDEYTDSGILNDEAYCSLYIQERITLRLLGPDKIKSELIRKGIPSDLIEPEISKAFEDIDLNRQASELLARKYRKSEIGPDNSQKAVQFLFRNGYDYHTAQTAVNHYLNPEE